MTQPPLPEAAVEQLLEHLAARAAGPVTAQLLPVVDARIADAMKRLGADLPRLTPSTRPVVPSQGPRRIGIAELEVRLGVNRTTIWRWYRAGHFPAPHFIGERRGWWLHEVVAWEQSREARSMAERRSNLRRATGS